MPDAAGAPPAVADDLPQELRDRSDAVKAKIGFTQAALSFRNMYYYVPMPDTVKEEKAKAGDEEKGDGAAKAAPKELTLLKGISGNFEPGVLTALMGASGAGKTTRMDVIAGRKTVGRMEGDIWVNGKPKVQETFRRING